VQPYAWPEDFARASEEMKNMTPDQIKSQMNAAMNQQKSQVGERHLVFWLSLPGVRLVTP
jgi:hypothetical protein